MNILEKPPTGSNLQTSTDEVIMDGEFGGVLQSPISNVIIESNDIHTDPKFCSLDPNGEYSQYRITPHQQGSVYPDLNQEYTSPIIKK